MSQAKLQNDLSETEIDRDELKDLSLGTVDERRQKNLDLWSKYRATDLKRAYVHLERAWNLGQRDLDTCKNLVHLMQQEGRMHDIQRVTQQAVYSAAQEKDLNLFIQFMNMYHRNAVGFGLQVQDPILNDLTDKLFSPLQPTFNNRDVDSSPHLAYLVPLAHDPKSTLPPLPFDFAKLQKDSQFTISIVLPLTKEQVERQNPRLMPMIEDVKALNVEIHYIDINLAERSFGQIEKLCNYLVEMDIDILCCLTQIYQDYFVAAMRPARHIIGIEFGHPEWYSSPFLDGITAAHTHLAMEAYTETLDVCIGSTKKFQATPTTLKLSDLGIGEDKKIILSSGAKDRLQNPDFWKLTQAIIQHTDYEWIIMGADENDKKIYLQGVAPDIASRIHCLGYRTDFSEVLALGDIYVDTFPVGGGYALIEAMAREIPCVTYKHNYNKIFRKHHNYFPMYDYVEDKDFAIEISGNEMLQRIVALMTDDSERKKQIKRQEDILKVMNTPERGIDDFNKALLKIVKD